MLYCLYNCIKNYFFTRLLGRENVVILDAGNYIKGKFHKNP